MIVITNKNFCRIIVWNDVDEAVVCRLYFDFHLDIACCIALYCCDKCTTAACCMIWLAAHSVRAQLSDSTGQCWEGLTNWVVGDLKSTMLAFRKGICSPREKLSLNTNRVWVKSYCSKLWVTFNHSFHLYCKSRWRRIATLDNNWDGSMSY